MKFDIDGLYIVYLKNGKRFSAAVHCIDGDFIEFVNSKGTLSRHFKEDIEGQHFLRMVR